MRLILIVLLALFVVHSVTVIESWVHWNCHDVVKEVLPWLLEATRSLFVLTGAMDVCILALVL